MVLSKPSSWLPRVGISKAEHRDRASPVPPDLAGEIELDLVGVNQIAARLGLDSQIVRCWHTAGKLPPPEYRSTSGETWLWSTMEQWKGGAGQPLIRVARLTSVPRAGDAEALRPLAEKPRTFGLLAAKKAASDRKGSTHRLHRRRRRRRRRRLFG